MNVWSKIKRFFFGEREEPNYVISKLNDYCIVVDRNRKAVYMSKNDTETIQWTIDVCDGGIIKLGTGIYNMDKQIIGKGINKTIIEGER